MKTVISLKKKENEREKSTMRDRINAVALEAMEQNTIGLIPYKLDTSCYIQRVTCKLPCKICH